MATAKQTKLIVNLVTKWAHVVAGTYAPNMEKARKLFDKLYCAQSVSKYVKVKKKGKVEKVWRTVKLKPPAFVFVQSPIAFNIAQAVMRGYLSKTAARSACAAFGIQDEFVASLRRDSLLQTFSNWRGWGRETSKLYDAWTAALAADVSTAATLAFFEPTSAVAANVLDRRGHRRRYGKDGPSEAALARHAERIEKRLTLLPARQSTVAMYEVTNNDMRRLCVPQKDSANVDSVFQFGNFAAEAAGYTHRVDAFDRLANVPWSSGCDYAIFSRWSEVSPVQNWGSSVFDGLLLCELLHANDNDFVRIHALMQEMPLFMTFKQHVLICLDRPTLKLNDAGELHCDDGPAVTWPDGAAQYWVDGHALGALGRAIVNHPERLTLRDIKNERNEEIKRFAIERYGWERYLHEIGARVLDRRENWVDNTVEALVETVTTIKTPGWRLNEIIERDLVQRKMILSCRSTGRKYFLPVPVHLAPTCEAAQSWMARGTEIEGDGPVAGLNRVPHIIGAS